MAKYTLKILYDFRNGIVNTCEYHEELQEELRKGRDSERTLDVDGATLT